MNDIAAACGTSKARLYHYYASKDAILFDLLDGYTLQLVEIAKDTTRAHAQGTSARAQGTAARALSAVTARKQLHTLIRLFLLAYEHAAARHIALVSSVHFLPEVERKIILERQRELIHRFSALVAAAYPGRKPPLAMPMTMMLFGMINWTFTWLKPDATAKDRITHAEFAELVIATLDSGFHHAT
jgi:AcrR family transcriptional regulator